jgi:hypothetical protein
MIGLFLAENNYKITEILLKINLRMSDMEDTFKQRIIDPEMDEQLLKYFVSHIHEHWVLLKELHSTFSETKAYVQTDDYNSTGRRTSESMSLTIKREVVTPVPPDELDAEEDVEVSDRDMQTEINDLPSPSLLPSAQNGNPPPRPRPNAIYYGPKPPTMAKKRRLIEGPPYVVKIPRVDGKNVGPRQNMEIFANDVQMGTLPVSTVNLASNWTEI